MTGHETTTEARLEGVVVAPAWRPPFPDWWRGRAQVNRSAFAEYRIDKQIVLAEWVAILFLGGGTIAFLRLRERRRRAAA